MRTELLKIQKKSLVLPSAFNKKWAALYVVIWNKKRAPSRLLLARENFSRNDFLYILVSLHSIWRGMEGHSCERIAPPAYRKKKKASSKFMRKKKAPFTVDKKRLSFSLGQGKRSWLSSSTFSKDERRARAQEERLEPPPSLENRNPFTKKVSPSLHPSTTRRKSPSSYSWWTKSISF